METVAKKNKEYTKLVKPIITKNVLIKILEELGIRKGMVVFVEANILKYNNIVGGNRTLIEALQEIITYDGCIICSGKTPYNKDLLSCGKVDVSFDKIEDIRQSIPPFNKKQSIPTNSFAQELMQYDGAIRSNHPLESFVAWGKYSKLICDKHQLHFAYGSESPLNKLKDLEGKVLMIGTKFENSDIFKYFANYDDNVPIRIVSSPIEKKGSLHYIEMLQKDYHEYDSLAFKQALEECNIVDKIMIGSAKTYLYDFKEAIQLWNNK